MDGIGMGRVCTGNFVSEPLLQGVRIASSTMVLMKGCGICASYRRCNRQPMKMDNPGNLVASFPEAVGSTALLTVRPALLSGQEVKTNQWPFDRPPRLKGPCDALRGCGF